jgi:hypothetical protein
MAFRSPFFVSTCRTRGGLRPTRLEMHENIDEPQRDADMEARLVKLEQFAEKTSDRLTEIERDLSVIKSNYATKADLVLVKADLANARSSIIVWVVSAVFLAQLLPLFLKRIGIA